MWMAGTDALCIWCRRRGRHLPRHPSSSWTSMQLRCRMGSSAQQAPPPLPPDPLPSAPLPPSPVPPSHQWRTRSRCFHLPPPYLQPSMPHPNSACLDPCLQLNIHLQSLISSFQLPFTGCLWACCCPQCALVSACIHAGYHFVTCVIILQAADRGLTPPPPPGLARPSGTASPSSNTTAGSKGNASLSSGMPTPNSPALGSPHSQPGQQFEHTRGFALALAAADRGGLGSGLRPDMLKRLGSGDGKPFGEHASGSGRGQGGDRQADTSRTGLSNGPQTPPIITDSTPQGQPGSELGDSNVGDGHSSGVAPTPASSSTRRRGPPAHLVARLDRNPFEDDHAQADTHQIRGTAVSQGSSGSGGSGRGRGRGRHATAGANHSHGRQQQQGGPRGSH